MILAYLWVKDFRGFKNQGFNFSNDFHINFDYTDNNNFAFEFKKIDDKIDYFPKNIYINLLVGKNGSGKTTILEIIKNGINEFYNKDNSDLYFALFLDETYKQIIIKGNFDGYKLKNNQSRLSDKLDKKLLIKQIKQEAQEYRYKIIENNTNYKIHNIYYTKTTKSYPDIQANLSKHLLNISDEYLYEKLSEDIQRQYKSTLRSFFQIKKLFDDEIFQNGLLAFYKNRFSFPKDWQKPQKLSVVFNHQYIITNYSYMLSKTNSNIKDKLEQIYTVVKIHDNSGIPLFNRMEWDYFIKYLAILNFIIQSNQGVGSDVHYEIFQNIPYNEKNDYKNNLDDIVKYFMQEFEIDRNTSYNISKKYFQKIDIIINKLRKFNDNYYSKGQFLIDITQNINDILEIIELHKSITATVAGFLSFRLYPIMSDGHQEFFNLFSKLYMAINTPFDNKKPNDNDTILILLDEPDNFLHPEWQRQFIDILVSFLSKNYLNYNFNIFIATHSPIMLSDIPKQNIIFLRDFENQKFDGNTLGANIHNILKNGFFLDKTMGEYISKIIENFIQLYYKDKNQENISLSLHDKIQIFDFVIKNIGDKYIQNILINHLEELKEKYPEILI